MLLQRPLVPRRRDQLTVAMDRMKMRSIRKTLQTPLRMAVCLDSESVEPWQRLEEVVIF